jgi:hypothetical protein
VKRYLPGFGIAAALPLLLAGPAGLVGSSAAAPSEPVQVASALSNPRQIAVAPDGSLYVAVAGSGAAGATHSGACGAGEEGPACTGDTGSLVKITSPDGTAVQKVVASGLLSLANQGDESDPTNPPGAAATGLDAVSVAPNGRIYGIFTHIPHAFLKGLPASVKHENGKLVRIGAGGKVTPLANVGRYSLNHPNKHHAPDSDPYGILATNHTIYLTDAANNTLLAFHKGKLTTLRVFPYRHGSGKDGSFDTVPTSLAKDRKGHLYVGTLGSLIPGKGRVYELSRRLHVIKVVKHLSQVDAVAVTPTGRIYAAEIFGGQSGPFTGPTPNGDVVTVTRGGSRTTTAVPLPGGVAVSGGHLYASEFSILAGAGTVDRLS